jgi:hypothetical protein
MTIGCTRCGATCEGDIILPPLAFGFKHNEGCGHGVGPLAVLPSSKKASDKVNKTIESELKDDIKVEEAPKKTKPKVEKTKVFGNNEDDN